MRTSDLSKRTVNSIRSRLDSMIGKYSFDIVRHVAGKHFNEILTKKKLEKEIQAKEKELKELRKGE